MWWMYATTEEMVLTSSYQDAHDIVLLDRMLPTMNGLLVLQKARQPEFPRLSY